ncbi:hypothetical protein [Corallococcus silvisoli]|uniref:hypothetical protein n=1 Tax=Corallococcus silvisoli TaxID=2697031 RepID=UPI001376C6C7|nr:hypothetical protein [Corallococcus silvisoli]NBD11848.1 hypothetical protein [Corallococcus silvisoli]
MTATNATAQPTEPLRHTDLNILHALLSLGEALAASKGANARLAYRETMETIYNNTGIAIVHLDESAGFPLLAKQNKVDPGDWRYSLSEKGRAYATETPFSAQGIAGRQILWKAETLEDLKALIRRHRGDDLITS